MNSARATGCATCCRAATWCRRAASAPSSPAGWARVWTSGWQRRSRAWPGTAAGVAVETPRGTITAALGHRHRLHRRAGGGRDRASIRRCRRTTQAAIHALPMGLAMKVALRATGPDRLDLPLHCSVDRQVKRSGDPTMGFQCWPHRRDYVQGWVGGPMAWELARAGEAAAVDFALGQLRALFGGRVDRLFAGGQRAGHALGRRSVRARRLFVRAAGRRRCAHGAGPAAGRRAPAVRRRGLPRRDGRHRRRRVDQRTGCGARSRRDIVAVREEPGDDNPGTRLSRHRHRQARRLDGLRDQLARHAGGGSRRRRARVPHG